MSAPFLILGLPRSRTAWLARFMTYGDWVCGHEEIRHMRSMADIKTWLSQPCVGSAETAAAPFWRLISPETRIVIVRRDPREVIESLMALPGVDFDRAILTRAINRMNKKLDQIAKRRPDALVVEFDRLRNEAVCARVFEHCLPYRHDHEWWSRLANVNIQCDMRAMMRHAVAFAAPLNKLAAVAKAHALSDMAAHHAPDQDGMTFQAEDFDTWLKDAEPLIDNHLMIVGEAPGDWRGKNLPLMRRIFAEGAMQIVTARSNGRMFGYLMTLIAPSLTGEDRISATNLTFYASPDCVGLGTKIQRASVAMLRDRGVHEVFFEAGQRGEGPRLGTMYRRMGAQDHGHVYRLELESV